MTSGSKKIAITIVSPIAVAALLALARTGADTFGVLSTAGFMPHRMCLSGSSALIWIDACADLVIFGAYMVIPSLLIKAFRHGIVIQPDNEEKMAQAAPLLIWFAAFILSCGLTHIMGTITIWYPYYYVDCALRIMTAVASVGTCVVLSRKLPILMGIVGITDLMVQVQKLTDQVQKLTKAASGIVENPPATSII